MKCARCEGELSRDERGLSYKLVSRASKSCYCLQCLSAIYGVSTKQLQALIEHFKAAGCTLFCS